MRRTWTIIGVPDVPGSFKWYQSLLGMPEKCSRPRRLRSNPRFGSNRLALPSRVGCPRASLADEPRSRAARATASFCFFVSMISTWRCRGHARSSLGSKEEPHMNPNTRTMEFSLRDSDGYYVTISALGESE